MSKQETVKVTLTVELPKKAKDLLEDFARHANTTVEAMFRNQILDMLSGFYQCGHFERWTEQATKDAKRIEKQFRKIYC